MTPKISVLIPALNEEKELPACLESLSRQTFDDFEIVVCDNGSTDDTARIARDYGARVVRERKRGIDRASQRAGQAARGEILAKTDADTVLPPDWLARIARSFRTRPEQMGLYGRILLRGGRPFDRWLISGPFTWLMRADHLVGRPHFCGANFAVRQEAFERTGGFRDPHTGEFYENLEDFQFSLKVSRFGEVNYDQGLVVYTSSRGFDRNPLYYVCVKARRYFIASFKQAFSPLGG